MSSAMPAFFDTHKYINTLKAAGFTEAQAEAQSSALVGVLEVNVERLATKEDLRVLGAELRGEMAELRSEMRGELRGVRGEIDQLRSMMRWIAGPSLIGIMATVVGMAALMIKNFA